MATPLNPTKYISLAKALYRTGSPIDARSQYLDVSVTPNLFRDFVNTQEVLDFLSNANGVIQSFLRSGGFPVFVNTGGTLANGVITGGTRSEYWFKDGVADGNLVPRGANISTDLTSNDDAHIPSVKAVNTGLAGSLSLTDAQKAALTAGVTYLAAIVKDPVTSATTIDPSIQSIDLFSPLDDATLSATSGWGNVAGQNSEYKKFTGDNRTGQLGRSAQIKVVAGTTYNCIQHSLGTGSTDGYAIYSRNRSVNFLDANNTDEAAIIAQLSIDSNFNSSTQLGVLTLKSTPGVAYVASNGGYVYICISQFTWLRLGFSTNYVAMAINSGSHPFLTGHLTAHNWTTGAYIQGSDTTTGTDEASYQGQKYWTNSYVYERNDVNKWVRIPLNA